MIHCLMQLWRSFAVRWMLSMPVANPQMMPEPRLQNIDSASGTPLCGIDLNSELAHRLVEALNSSDVVYCHWKSNIRLAQALSGATDLDLLVERKSLPKALSILMSLGFRPAVPRWEPRTPGVSHHYGLDPQTGHLIHVHLFSRVITGESLTKSHSLPFESMLLDNSRQVGQIRVGSKPAELVVFVLRVFIKYGSLLDLIRLVGKSEDLKAELSWLLSDSDMSDVLRLLRRHCPVMDEQLFVKCIETLSADSSLIERIAISQRVRRSLRVYSRFSRTDRALAHIHVLWSQVRRRLSGSRKNRVPYAGGTVIAFVGPDASGKSTLVSECKRWLGEAFAVRTAHAGKPPPSGLTVPVSIVLPLVRSLLPRLRPSRLEVLGSSTNPAQSRLRADGLPSLIYALRALTLAWDRRRLLVKARRSAANGEIVICDRYPSQMLGAMDSRRLQENPTKGGSIAAIHNFLARVEDRLYRQIPPPDIVLRLKVSLETVERRNGERIKAGNGREANMESRHRQSQLWHTSGTRYTYDIDTEQSLAETILHVKKVIWESL
jgi:thymidylate kinase